MATRQELLDYLWRDVINAILRDDALDTIVRGCRGGPQAPFADTGPAIERMLAQGVSPCDLQLVLRHAAYEAVFGTLYAICDPGEDQNEVFGLYEDLLSSDPSGKEGGPGSADAV